MISLLAATLAMSSGLPVTGFAASSGGVWWVARHLSGTHRRTVGILVSIGTVVLTAVGMIALSQ
jgi:hypothetical protein